MTKLLFEKMQTLLQKNKYIYPFVMIRPTVEELQIKMHNSRVTLYLQTEGTTVVIK